MVIVTITGNFLAMALTTDNVRALPRPNAWLIGTLTMAGIVMGVCLLTFCSAVLAVGRFRNAFADPGTDAQRARV